VRILTLLISAGLILVILGIALSIGAKITTDVGDSMSGTAKDAALNSTTAIADLSEWQTTISTVVAAVVIIGLLLAGFGGFLAFGGRGGV
jgi:hypothetical protein